MPEERRSHFLYCSMAFTVPTVLAALTLPTLRQIVRFVMKYRKKPLPPGDNPIAVNRYYYYYYYYY